MNRNNQQNGGGGDSAAASQVALSSDSATFGANTNGDNNNNSNTLTNMTNLSASISNRIKFSVNGGVHSNYSNSTLSSSSHSNGANNNNNGTSNVENMLNAMTTIRNREDLRNSINSHATNQYASEKVLPLTVACHFKVKDSYKLSGLNIEFLSPFEVYRFFLHLNKIL